MYQKISILMIEDEKSICDFISKTLNSHQYKVNAAHNGKDGLTMITSSLPDLVLLDLGLPDMDGLEVIKKTREWSSLPIIVISARTQEKEKVAALDAGADDYITKPFGMMEFIARVRAVLRRAGKEEKENDVLETGDLQIQVKQHQVLAKGEKVTLTLKEFELLKFLMENKGIVLTRDRLLGHVWGYDFDGETRTVDVHVRTLRQKLGECGELIETVRGVGYRIGG